MLVQVVRALGQILESFKCRYTSSLCPFPYFIFTFFFFTFYIPLIISYYYLNKKFTTIQNEYFEAVTANKVKRYFARVLGFAF
jgi:uncharacterized protein with PQ loop repeat